MATREAEDGVAVHEHDIGRDRVVEAAEPCWFGFGVVPDARDMRLRVPLNERRSTEIPE